MEGAKGKTAERVNSLRVRRRYLIIGSISIFFAGVIYAWSILKVPFAEDFHWTSSQLALNFTFTFCLYCVGCLAAGVLLKKVGYRTSMLLASALVLAGFLIVSAMSGQHTAALYIGYGVIAAFGIGIAYISIVSAVKAWFPDKPGVCSGVLMMFFGISSLFLGSVVSRLFELPGFGWRKTYLYLGVSIFTALAVGGVAIRFPTADIVLPETKAASAQRENFEALDCSAGQMLRRKTFWLFYAYNVLTAAVGNSVFSFARDFALSVGATAAFATALVGVTSVCNGSGRILSGVLYDRLGRKRTMLAVNLLVILAAALLLAAAAAGSVAVCVLGLCCAGVCYGCGSTISATFVGSFYGKQDYSLNLSIVTSALIPASFTATISSVLLGRSGSYVSTFVMLICCGVLALVLNVNIKRP